MKRLNEIELDARIQTFLHRKRAEFPELTEARPKKKHVLFWKGFAGTGAHQRPPALLKIT